MAISVTDYSVVMFPKVKELKSSQTHAISILSLALVLCCSRHLQKNLGLNGKAEWLMLLLQLNALLPYEIKEVRVVRKTDIYKNWTTARLSI